MPNTEQIVELFHNELRSALDSGHPELLRALAGQIAGQPTELPAEGILDALWRGGCSLGRLLAGLKRCELRHLELLLPQLGEAPLAEQAGELAEVTGHYAAVQQRWLAWARAGLKEPSALPAADAGREPPPLEQQQEQDIIARLRKRWRAAGQVRIFNYFHELEVTAVVRVVAIEGDCLTVAINPRLERVFAAGERMRYANVPATEPDRVLRVEIHGRRGGELTLRIAGLAPHPEGRRVRVRVRVNEPLRVMVALPGRPHEMAWIVDMSDSGMGVLFDDPVELHSGDAVTVTGTLRTLRHAIELQARGVVHWAGSDDDGQVRAGIELALDSADQARLQTVLREYEQQIIQKLRAVGTPDPLR